MDLEPACVGGANERRGDDAPRADAFGDLESLIGWGQAACEPEKVVQQERSGVAFVGGSCDLWASFAKGAHGLVTGGCDHHLRLFVVRFDRGAELVGESNDILFHLDIHRVTWKRPKDRLQRGYL